MYYLLRIEMQDIVSNKNADSRNLKIGYSTEKNYYAANVVNFDDNSQARISLTQIILLYTEKISGLSDKGRASVNYNSSVVQTTNFLTLRLLSRKL